jgi:hypothetical protein
LCIVITSEEEVTESLLRMEVEMARRAESSKEEASLYSDNRRIPANSCKLGDGEMLSVASGSWFCSLLVLLSGEERRTEPMRIFVEERIRGFLLLSTISN